MAIQYDKLFSIVTDYRNKKELNPFVNFLKKICENKQKISVDVTNDDGQNYCQALADAVIDKMIINTDEVLVIEVITDCLLQQANLTNTRWYLLDKCQLLHCLARKFLSTQSVAVKIRIGKTMQTFLIYSRIDETSCLISLELVADLLKNLVFTIRGNFSQEFNETALGLLASLCQIWSTCSSVMNVIKLGPSPGEYDFKLPDISLPITSSFKSKSGRFNYPNYKYPGPGTYDKSYMSPPPLNLRNLGRQHGLFFSTSFCA